MRQELPSLQSSLRGKFETKKTSRGRAGRLQSHSPAPNVLHSTGNIIEYRYPPDVELPGVEFRAMPSGSHLVESDFVAFSLSNVLFGISCFHSRRDPTAARGMHARSIGILCAQYSSLLGHREFLQRMAHDIVQNPTGFNFNQLEDYFLTHSENPMLTAAPPSVSSPVTSIRFHGHYQTGSLVELVQKYRENIFVLWKLALLQQRIIFLCSPPVGAVCSQVLGTTLLAAKTHASGAVGSPVHPLFYITLVDINGLEGLESYAACVTETIFESKTKIYDVFVKGTELTPHDPELADVCTPNAADLNRLAQLLKFCQAPSVEALQHDSDILRYFLKLNDGLLHTFEQVLTTEEMTLMDDSVELLGLDPVADANFVSMAVELYCPQIQCAGPVGGLCF
eukprot:m.209684 g.209684  ORF g.209684 m.209684 type:complete len:395 (-) comp10729_c0_seq13:2609-3793(-)